MAAYLKKPFSHNLLIARKPLIRVTYETGLKVSDEELAELALERDEFHGEWNYRLHPREKLVAT